MRKHNFLSISEPTVTYTFLYCIGRHEVQFKGYFEDEREKKELNLALSDKKMTKGLYRQCCSHMWLWERSRIPGYLQLLGVISV